MKIEIIKSEFIKARVPRRMKREVQRIAEKNEQTLSDYLRAIVAEDLRKNGVEVEDIWLIHPIVV